MNGGSTAHFGHHRRVNADIVVFDIVAVDLDRTFEMLVGDGIAVCLHILEYAVAHPFAEGRPLTEPSVSIGSCGRRDDGGDFLVLAVRHLQAVLEVFLKAGKQRFQCIWSDNHALILV